MALTTSNIRQDSSGSQRKTTGTIAFDNSYPTGGEVLTAAQLGLGTLEDFEIKSSEQGFIFEVTVANNAVTIEVFDAGSGAHTPAGTVAAPVFTGAALATHTHTLAPIEDELLAVVANTATLANTVASVSSVVATVGGSPGPMSVTSPGAGAPAAGSAEVVHSTGVVNFNAADAITAAVVTYLPQNGVVAITAGTPAGTNSAPAFTGTPVGAGAASEVANGTDLTALSTVEFEAAG